MNKNTKIILALLGAAVAASALAVFLKQERPRPLWLLSPAWTGAPKDRAGQGVRALLLCTV